MAIYTYDDIMSKMQETGVNLSDVDLSYAEKYPDTVMSILNARIGYKNAKTPEEKAYFHDIAETNRGMLGYSGGADGNQFLITEQTPSSFDMAEYENPYEDQLNSAVDDLTNRNPYDSQYDDRINAALDALTTREAYSSQYGGQINDILSGNYDISSNPMYQSYAKANAREAQRSAQDALGSAAALTGGMASSYATTAASQAADYYNSQTADALPDILAATLSQLQTQDNTDYQRYLDQIGLTRDDISTMQSLDNTDYQRYLDDIGLTNDEINTLLSVTAEDYNRFSTQQQLAYQQVLDNIEHKANREDAANAQELAKNGMNLDAMLGYASLTENYDALKALFKKLGIMD